MRPLNDAVGHECTDYEGVTKPGIFKNADKKDWAKSFLQADQAIEVCDDTKIVQYVNRAYETVTGCLRSEVLGESFDSYLCSFKLGHGL